jgi:hypothetical protein
MNELENAMKVSSLNNKDALLKAMAKLLSLLLEEYLKNPEQTEQDFIAKRLKDNLQRRKYSSLANTLIPSPL